MNQEHIRRAALNLPPAPLNANRRRRPAWPWYVRLLIRAHVLSEHELKAVI